MRLIRTVALLTACTLAGAGAALAQAATARASRTPHPTTGTMAECLRCHGPDANEHIQSVPDEHHYANDECVRCHRPAAAMPTNSEHPMDAAHARCAVCHVAGSPTNATPIPAGHVYHASTCTMCHVSAPHN